MYNKKSKLPPSKRPKENFADADVSKFPHFEPPLTVYLYEKARKHIMRNERILAPLLAEPRAVWKIDQTMVQIIFDFYTSPNIIQVYY